MEVLKLQRSSAAKGSSRGRSKTVSLGACTKCEQIKRSQEIVLYLTLAGSDVLDRFGSFRGGERKRGDQPMAGTENKDC